MREVVLLMKECMMSNIQQPNTLLYLIELQMTLFEREIRNKYKLFGSCFEGFLKIIQISENDDNSNKIKKENEKKFGSQMMSLNILNNTREEEEIEVNQNIPFYLPHILLFLQKFIKDLKLEEEKKVFNKFLLNILRIMSHEKLFNIEGRKRENLDEIQKLLKEVIV